LIPWFTRKEVNLAPVPLVQVIVIMSCLHRPVLDSKPALKQMMLLVAGNFQNLGDSQSPRSSYDNMKDKKEKKSIGTHPFLVTWLDNIALG
jgi:hypothetical protein